MGYSDKYLFIPPPQNPALEGGDRRGGMSHNRKEPRALARVGSIKKAARIDVDTDFDNRWHIYWKRKTGKWWPYIPKEDVYTVEDCIKELDEDGWGCFWG